MSCCDSAYEQDLIASNGLFKTLVTDFGSDSKSRDSSSADKEANKDPHSKVLVSQEGDPALAKSAVKLMLEEERETGEVKWSVYTGYMRAMGNWWWAVFIAAVLILEQVATVGNSLMLGFWSNGTISGFAQAQYMAVYAGECTSRPFAGRLLTVAGLGLAVAVFTVSMSQVAGR